MKLFLFILIAVTNMQAATLEKIRTNPEGVDSQKFILGEKEASLEKKSNFFDMQEKDYSVGTFKLIKMSPDYQETLKKISELSLKVKKVDEYLKIKSSRYNEIVGAPKDDVIIMIDDFRIIPESRYYTELDRLFKKLQNLDWKMMKGFRITPDLEKLLEIVKGEVLKTSKFELSTYCKKAQIPTICIFDENGRVHLR